MFKNIQEGLPQDAAELLRRCEGVTQIHSMEQLEGLSLGNRKRKRHDVYVELPDGERVLEATIVRAKNGIAVNFPDTRVRKRDPDCMCIGDNLPTEKTRFADRFGYDFSELRAHTMDLLSKQELIVMPVHAGGSKRVPIVVIAPKSCAVFALMVATLQKFVPIKNVSADFKAQGVIYLEPSVRHTHFCGEQVVVHCRGENGEEVHELFSFNLYPGPSAKKGIYGMLLELGLRAKNPWTVLHAAVSFLRGPQGTVIVLLHMGPSGCGKSESASRAHLEEDGRMLIGVHHERGDKLSIAFGQALEIHPVLDDMAVWDPSAQDGDYICVEDAEEAWFIRVNHITRYGQDPAIEALVLAQDNNILSLNITAVPDGEILPYEHVYDVEPSEENPKGKKTPNPRVIVRRAVVPGIRNGIVAATHCSIGLRQPPCSRETPSYGILGVLQVMPPALAYAWSLVCPRGHDNPSIISEDALASESVGSFWAFATGVKVDYANVLLQVYLQSPKVKHLLIPNQHCGGWETGFGGMWYARHWLACQGTGEFLPDLLTPARCALLGYDVTEMTVNGVRLPSEMLQVWRQPEVGPAGYDAGAEILKSVFERELTTYLHARKFNPIGKQIIEAVLRGASVEELAAII